MRIVQKKVVYPESDGKPMGETPLHRRDINDLIEELDQWFAGDPMVYVSGNMMLYYEEGNPRHTRSPDVQVTFGIPKLPERRVYLVWVEGKGPDLIIEVTSRKTARVDLGEKMVLYRDVLRVREYFLFDPYEEHLKPSLQGFRLVRGRYLSIREVNGRLPSQLTGLHLERNAHELRLYDPATGKWLLSPRELHEAQLQAEEARRREEEARKRIEAENERLRQELEALRRRPPNA